MPNCIPRSVGISCIATWISVDKSCEKRNTTYRFTTASRRKYSECGSRSLWVHSWSRHTALWKGTKDDRYCWYATVNSLWLLMKLSCKAFFDLFSLSLVSHSGDKIAKYLAERLGHQACKDLAHQKKFKCKLLVSPFRRTRETASLLLKTDLGAWITGTDPFT